MVAAERLAGVRPNSVARIRRLLADTAQQADWAPSCSQDIPGFWG